MSGVVYMCLHSTFKLQPQFDGVLAGILRRVPDSVILFTEGRRHSWTQLVGRTHTPARTHACACVCVCAACGTRDAAAWLWRRVLHCARPDAVTVVLVCLAAARAVGAHHARRGPSPRLRASAARQHTVPVRAGSR